jgi:hypothetical protein
VVVYQRKSRAERVVGVKPRPASRLAPHGGFERAIEDRPRPVRGWGDQDPKGQREAHSRSALIAIMVAPSCALSTKRCVIMLFHDEPVKMKGASQRNISGITVGQMFEELGRTPPAFGREGDEVVQVLGGVMQAEELEGVREWGHRGVPPTTVGA